ncbi:MAG: gamma carbonic anhydrase family protein [Acidobacteria bacterium]|nr:MAG: gamma carbonic anhydrase family protein [Acidobacteriota bacterium]
MTLPHLLKDPIIPESCYIDTSARINGDVQMGEFCSVWFNASIRGDVHIIKMGDYTNIQDGCVLHTTKDKFPLHIGKQVTFGHGVIAHGSTIEDCVFLGMQSLIMDGSVIGNHTIIGAGSLVTEGKKIPSGVLAFGRPAKVVRDLTEAEWKMVETHAKKYAGYADSYREAGLFTSWKDNPYYRSPSLGKRS